MCFFLQGAVLRAVCLCGSSVPGLPVCLRRPVPWKRMLFSRLSHVSADDCPRRPERRSVLSAGSAVPDVGLLRPLLHAPAVPLSWVLASLSASMGYFINARDRPHRSKSLKSLISPDKICIIVNLLLSSQTGSPCRKPVADVGGLQKGMLRDGSRRCPRLSSGCGNTDRHHRRGHRPCTGRDSPSVIIPSSPVLPSPASRKLHPPAPRQTFLSVGGGTL